MRTPVQVRRDVHDLMKKGVPFLGVGIQEFADKALLLNLVANKEQFPGELQVEIEVLNESLAEEPAQNGAVAEDTEMQSDTQPAALDEC